MADVNVTVNLDTGPAEKDAEGLKAKLGKTFGEMGKIAGGVFMAEVGGAIASKGVETLKNSIGLARDYNEILSKSNTIFGEQAGAIEKWASGASTGFGQSKASALDAAASFGNMFTQLGMGGTVAADMSVKMTELASDFASFHNADITEVLTAQQAAFRGEYDALQRFVPTINAAAVAQEAMAQTGKKSTAELTAGEKAAATYTLMLKGAGDAQGDFDRTSGSLANQQRILSAQWTDFQTQIGQVLIPALTRIVTTLNTQVIPAVAQFAGDVKRYWESDIKPAVDNIVAAWEKIAPVIEPLVKVTLVALEVQFKALVTPIKILIDLLSGDFDQALRDAKALVDTVVQGMKEAFGLLKDSIEEAIPLAGAAAKAVGKAIFDGIWEGLGDLWQLGADVIDWVLQGLKAMAGGLIAEAKRIGGEIADALNPVNAAKGVLGKAKDALPLLQADKSSTSGATGAYNQDMVWDARANAYVYPWEVGLNSPTGGYGNAKSNLMTDNANAGRIEDGKGHWWNEATQSWWNIGGGPYLDPGKFRGDGQISDDVIDARAGTGLAGKLKDAVGTIFVNVENLYARDEQEARMAANDIAYTLATAGLAS